MTSRLVSKSYRGEVKQSMQAQNCTVQMGYFSQFTLFSVESIELLWSLVSGCICVGSVLKQVQIYGKSNAN